MTFLGIIITLSIGILLLVSGALTKRKLLMFISIIPLVIALIQIGMILAMSLN